MIYCCNGKYQADRILHLSNFQNLHKRYLEILNKCPNCNAKIAVLSETRLTDNHQLIQRFKNHKADNKIQESLKELAYEYHLVKAGTRATMNWRYSKITEIRNKKNKIIEIRHRTVDFNDTKELISTIDLRTK